VAGRLLIPRSWYVSLYILTFGFTVLFIQPGRAGIHALELKPDEPFYTISVRLLGLSIVFIDFLRCCTGACLLWGLDAIIFCVLGVFYRCKKFVTLLFAAIFCYIPTNLTTFMIPTFVLSSLWPEVLLFLCNLPHGRFFLFLVYTSLPWALDFGF